MPSLWLAGAEGRVGGGSGDIYDIYMACMHAEPHMQTQFACVAQVTLMVHAHRYSLGDGSERRGFSDEVAHTLVHEL